MIHEKNIIQNNVTFSNDLFFKYLLSRDTFESKKIRKFIVKSVTGLDCQQMIVKNPEINQNTVLAKNIILDICAVDEKGRIIDIEMQMAGSSNSESTRFQFYGARLLVEQIDTGEKYHQLRPVYQIIFINEDDDRLIKEYAFRDDQGEVEKSNLNYRYFIKMRHIDKLIKEKGIAGLDDLERLCYLFIKNEYPDLVICDTELHNMDGVELSSRLKTSCETSIIPIILYSSHIDIDQYNRRKTSLADTFLQQPFSIADLKIEMSIHIKNNRFLRKSFLQRLFGEEFLEIKASEILQDGEHPLISKGYGSLPR